MMENPNHHQETHPDEKPSPYQAAMAASMKNSSGAEAQQKQHQQQQQQKNTVRWILDDEVDTCNGCGLMFDWVRRKHHCRFCGHVHCDECTQRRSLIPEEKILMNPSKTYMSVNKYNPQRVCEPCFEQLVPAQEKLRITCSNAVQPNSIQEAGSRRFFNSPYSFTLQEEIRKAAYSVNNFLYDGIIKDQSIPLPLLSKAKGLAFLTVIKAGFLVSGRIGTGIVISKLPSGQWSAPSAIGTAGIGWGAQIGGEVTDFVIILNTRSAVDTFAAQGQVNLGAELGVAAGPVGRVASGAMEASPSGFAPCYSYSHSKGLFIGISLEGSVIAARPDINRAFYGKDKVSAAELLSGVEPPPVAAQPLYVALDRIFKSPSNSINRFSAQNMSSGHSATSSIPDAILVPPVKSAVGHSNGKDPDSSVSL